MKARGGSVVASDHSRRHQARHDPRPLSDYVLELPRAPELITPILMVVPLQLLAYDIAVARAATSISLEISRNP